MAYTFKHGDRPVDGYTIQRAVGKGGFGEVYYAVSDGGREVAIKYLRDNPQIELRGVSHCINLKSPHLVSIFDVKKTVDDEYSIIMEYCSGPSLRDLLIAEPSGFEPQKAAFFVREIAKGLSYLHDRGIVHRDLKPGNIFYDDGYVKICDYGLSKFISVSRHSAQTASVGTVHYMAPEIGSGNYSRGVDIYALGVILYEMLLGKVPFEGSSMGEVLMKHLTTQPEVEHLPHPFGRVIRKALQKDPNDRYQTVDEMVEELLEVDEVRESLAGFSTQSLKGAVQGGRDRADSPIPSPNPTPGYARDFGQRGATHGQPPYATPVGQGAWSPSAGVSPSAGALPKRVAKRMDRISRKMEKKIAKMGGRPPAPPQPAQYGQPGNVPPLQWIAPQDRKKRMLLSGLLSVGLAVGLGILIGTQAGSDEAGAAAGMLVIAMSFGIIVSRNAVNWFGVLSGPVWPRRLVQLCCCMPILGVGAAPLLERSSEQGMALWLGLLFVSVFANWEKTLEVAPGGEMSFRAAIGRAFFALLATMITSGIFVGEPTPEVFLAAAGVAGAATLILQATAWWLPYHAARAIQHLGGDPRQAWQGRAPTPPPPADPSAATYEARAEDARILDPAQATPPVDTPGALPAPISGLRLRWGVTRAFWGVVAFVLMGGVIVTFLIMLIVGDGHYHYKTGVLVGCMACGAFMLFALRKTTPVKRDGFWRETLRPFLISLTMFGIGGTITGIARESGHRAYCACSDSVVPCVPDEGHAALITGLVMCSLLFLGLTFFTGRRCRTREPFLVTDASSGGGHDAGAVSPEDASKPEESESAT